ncbi:MAG: PQQ-like beta-propeller repeat protein, partial [Thermoleophilia bacterium]|nr:PQQ-like beta-propeller repeat protein [Thermoleophilia bacterium]
MTTAPRSLLALNLCLLLVALGVLAAFARTDSSRPIGPLKLAWERHEPALAPAWPDQPRFTSDAARKPVFAGDAVLFASSRHDTLTAVERQTGKTRWTFAADGPIRFAPAAWEGKAYAASDDGRLYCLSVEDGRVLWSFQGGPHGRLVLGNERLVSMWPARGAPALARDGDEATVYFAAGIWPFMGVFLHALDARTGEPRWSNSGDGATWMKQPHSADAYAGIAPQGQLVVVGDRLLVAGGRSVPACYDRRTGKRLHYLLNEGSKQGGGPDVVPCGDLYANGGGAFSLATGKPLGPVGEPTAAEGGVLYSASAGRLRAWRVEDRPEEEKPGKKGKKKKGPSEGWLGRPAGTLASGLAMALCAADGVVFGGGPGRVFGIEGLADGSPRLAWQERIDGTPAHIAADGDDVCVSTREGKLYLFRAGVEGPAEKHPRTTVPLPAASKEEERAVRTVLEKGGQKEGYAVLVRPSGIGFVAELMRRSALKLAVLEPDAGKAAELRAALREANIDGTRAAVLGAGIEALPPYLGSLLLLDKPIPSEEAKRPLRPFGGTALLYSGEPVARREGALPGAGDWSHQHADAANSRVGADALVKAPLGLLWFGGPGHQGILPRHGHGPVPQVCEGRLVIEGPDLLRSIDIYTGRLLWETTLPGLG